MKKVKIWHRYLMMSMEEDGFAAPKMGEPLEEWFPKMVIYLTWLRSQQRN